MINNPHGQLQRSSGSDVMQQGKISVARNAGAPLKGVRGSLARLQRVAPQRFLNGKVSAISTAARDEALNGHE
jgi:hypothetical protein